MSNIRDEGSHVNNSYAQSGREIFDTIIEVLLRQIESKSTRQKVGALTFGGFEKSTLTVIIPDGRARPELAKRVQDIIRDNGFTSVKTVLYATPDGSALSAENNEGHEIRLTPYSQIEPEHLDYIWPNYIARKKLHHWAGNSIQGKSPVAIDLIACVTSPARRATWPDGTPNKNRPQAVMLLAGEDDHSDTVRPRLAVAKADASLVYDVQCTVKINDKATEKLVALDRDITALILQAQKVKNLGLIVIDPITNYLGKVPMNKEEKVREILMPLAEAARSLRVAVVTIGHLNRRETGTDPLQRIMGAAAFHGVARFVYLFGPDPEDADQYAHVMVQRRGCGAPALRYKTRAESHKWKGKSSSVIKVVWRGASKATAEAVVDPQTSEQKTQVKEAAKALREFVARGPKPSKNCIVHLKDMGFDLDKLNSTRVRDAAGVWSERCDLDKFYSWGIKNEEV